MERIPEGLTLVNFGSRRSAYMKWARNDFEIAKRLSWFGETLKNIVYAAHRGNLGEVGKNQNPPTFINSDLI